MGERYLLAYLGMIVVATSPWWVTELTILVCSAVLDIQWWWQYRKYNKERYG